MYLLKRKKLLFCNIELLLAQRSHEHDQGDDCKLQRPAPGGWMTQRCRLSLVTHEKQKLLSSTGTSPYDQYHGVESQFRYLLESPELCSRHRKIPLNYEYASHLTPGGSCCVAECPEDYIPVIDEFSTTFSQTPDHVSQPPYLLIERCAPTGGSLAV